MKKIDARADVPVQMFIRITRYVGDPRERAKLVAKDDQGREFAFTYDDYHDEAQDLTVCDLPTSTSSVEMPS
jgi:hypothetical protein